MTPITGKVSVVLQNCDHIGPHLFALQGISGKTYGTAQYERPKGGHRITLPLEEFLAAAEDIARASTRPMSFWRVAEVLVDADESSDGKLAAALEEAQAQIAQLTLERDAAIRAIPAPAVSVVDSMAGVSAAQERIKSLTAELSATRTARNTFIREQGLPIPWVGTAEDGRMQMGRVEACEFIGDIEPTTITPLPSATAAATAAAAEPLPAAELPPLPAPSSRREYLEAVPQFRTLRREAKDAGVAGVETFTERGPLIAAILAAEATAPEAAPVTDEAATEQNG